MPPKIITVKCRQVNGRKETQEYSLTALKENVALLDVVTINEINDLIVAHGHRIVKKKRGPHSK
jgi:hypothetical protein